MQHEINAYFIGEKKAHYEFLEIYLNFEYEVKKGKTGTVPLGTEDNTASKW